MTKLSEAPLISAKVGIGIDEVRTVGRATQGVRLVRLDDEGYVVGFDSINERDEIII